MAGPPGPPDRDAPRGSADPAAAPSFRLVVTTLAVVVALLAGVPALVRAVRGPGGPSDAEVVAEVAEGFLAAWAAGDRAALDARGGGPHVAEAYGRLADDLQVTAVRAARERVRVRGDEATARFSTELDLRGLGTWAYEGALGLTRRDDPPEGGSGWEVAWAPAAVHPSLGPDDRLARTRERPARAPVLAVDGTPLDGPAAPALPGLAASVLGRVAPATADDVAADATGRLAVGDPVGRSGLQARHDASLTGTAAGAVLRVDAAGAVVEELHRFPGAPGQPLRTTIDPAVQAAAEEVIGTRGGPAALVAVDAATGGVRAVVSRPIGGFDRAVVGRYPPGSTFKVVTAAALLGAGLDPATVVPCPARTSVEGRSFGNFAGEALGDIPFRTAFARSCNTAFVQLASGLEPGALAAAARSFGFDDPRPLPLEEVGGAYPDPASAVELAASAIGQGRVTASPLHMASVAAAVAAGGWRPPTLVDGPAPAPTPLDPGVAATLAELMGVVVAEGTGTAAAVPGTPVAGKTGTAEVGTAVPPATHGWFIGFRDGLAVSVLVEGAPSGGEVAAPLAGAFLGRL